jgi:Protein of unknown function (DUF1572)
MQHTLPTKKVLVVHFNWTVAELARVRAHAMTIPQSELSRVPLQITCVRFSWVIRSYLRLTMEGETRFPGPCRGPSVSRREAVSQSESDRVGAAVIASAVVAFRSNKGWADKAIAQLSDEKLHVALDPNTNCVAVIMKHVGGNLLSRWTDFLTTDGEKPWRNRDDEFVDSFATRSELLDHWEKGWNRLFETLASLTPTDLAKTVLIRGEPHSVPLAIHRSLAHCGYHVGQIIMIARILAGDQWQTITIPRGKSAAFNQAVWGQGHFQTTPSDRPAAK